MPEEEATKHSELILMQEVVLNSSEASISTQLKALQEERNNLEMRGRNRKLLAALSGAHRNNLVKFRATYDCILTNVYSEKNGLTQIVSICYLVLSCTNGAQKKDVGT